MKRSNMSHNEEVRAQLDAGCAKLDQAPLNGMSDWLQNQLNPENVREMLDGVAKTIMELQAKKLTVLTLAEQADDDVDKGTGLISSALAGTVNDTGVQAMAAAEATASNAGELYTYVHGLDDGTPDGHLETALAGVGAILASLEFFDAVRQQALGALGEAAMARTATKGFVEEYKQQSL
jgi:hypothetical protein